MDEHDVRTQSTKKLGLVESNNSDLSFKFIVTWDDESKPDVNDEDEPEDGRIFVFMTFVHDKFSETETMSSKDDFCSKKSEGGEDIDGEESEAL
ncbi:hypothetical protein U1Q18_007802 [Sarracenia purpurea var. burkii]